MTPGGESRGEVSLKTRKKLHDANIGKHISTATKQKISKKLLGRQFTEEHKQKISEGQPKRKVICIETTIIYNSVNEARHLFGDAIKDCLAKRTPTAYGYHWAYLNDEKTINELSMYKWGEKNASKTKAKPVLCIETHEIFNSLTQAIQKYGRSISDCLCGRIRTAYKYHWKYIK